MLINEYNYYDIVQDETGSLDGLNHECSREGHAEVRKKSDSFSKARSVSTSSMDGTRRDSLLNKQRSEIEAIAEAEVKDETGSLEEVHNIL